MDDIKASAILKSLAAGVSPDDGSSLLAAFDGGATIDTLTQAHERTRAGIEARLVKHGRLDAEQAPAARIR